MRGLFLLTMKPVTYAANVNEGDLADQGAGNPHVAALREKAETEGRQVVIVSAQVGFVSVSLSEHHSSNGLDAAAGRRRALARRVAIIAAQAKQAAGQASRSWGVRASSAWPALVVPVHAGPVSADSRVTVGGGSGNRCDSHSCTVPWEGGPPEPPSSCTPIIQLHTGGVAAGLATRSHLTQQGRWPFEAQLWRMSQCATPQTDVLVAGCLLSGGGRLPGTTRLLIPSPWGVPSGQLPLRSYPAIDICTVSLFFAPNKAD